MRRGRDGPADGMKPTAGPQTHLFPVVEDYDFAVLIVNGHRALVAFACGHTTHAAHVSARGTWMNNTASQNQTWRHAMKSEMSALARFLTQSGHPHTLN